MFEEINKELEELKQGIRRHEKIDSMLNSLQDQQKELEEKAANYQKDLDKEELEVELLNKKSLTAIFYKILGSKEEQIEKERQEALAAKLKLDDSLKQIEDTKYQISKLIEERNLYADNEIKYNILYKKKYNLLKESGNIEYENIMKIEESISGCKSNQMEIKEAVRAGNLVMDRITSAVSSLNSAEGWGLWDMWGGGGFITDMIKHSHIDAARDAASQIQSLLYHFRSELADIKINSEIHIEIEGFAKFADFFFDGLISDWVVQSRINDSMESVISVKVEVGNVLRKLEQMQTSIDNELIEQNQKLKNYIESV